MSAAAAIPASDSAINVECVDAEVVNPTDADLDARFGPGPYNASGPIGDIRALAIGIPAGGASKFVKAMCALIPTEPPSGVGNDGAEWLTLVKKAAATPNELLFEHGLASCLQLKRTFGTVTLQEGRDAAKNIGDLVPGIDGAERAAAE